MGYPGQESYLSLPGHWYPPGFDYMTGPYLKLISEPNGWYLREIEKLSSWEADLSSSWTSLE